MDIKKGTTIWLTGLPCSGKTTIANELKKELIIRRKEVEVLDGDEIRKNLWNDLGFSKEDRIKNLTRVIYLARLFTNHRITTIVSFVSPYRSIRALARKQLQPFIEVYVKCPVEICRKRDVKGMYKQAVSGEIKDFTGISHNYEKPKNPELVLETDKLSIKESVDKILHFLTKQTNV